MMRYGQVLLTLCCCVLLLSPAAAQLYTWKDKDGRIVISDNPPPGLDKQIEKVGEERLFQSAPQQQSPAQTAPVAAPVQEERMRPARDIKVVLYVTSWCGYCKKAREYLGSLGASVAEFDIERQPEKREEMLKKSNGARGVPVIDVEGIIIRGYNPGAIKAAIEQRMRS